jgi:hypothetical protein
MLLLGAGFAAQTGCGGRYMLDDGSAGAALATAGASAVGRAGEPGVVNAQPGGVAGGLSIGGSFSVGGGGPVPIGGSFGVAGGFPIQGTGGGSVITPSVCDGPGTRVLTPADAVLDSFEEATILSQWSAFADLGAPGVDATDNTLRVLLSEPGAVGTIYAGEYLGKGGNPASKPPGFGVGAILNVAIDTKSGLYCADISAFDGISFWAKTGVPDSVFDVDFVLPSTNAASAGGGGDCLTNCYNHPRKRVAPTGSWAQYAIRFDDAAGGSAKVKNVIQEIAWLSPDSRWDFSIDEITFYKGIPPAGAVGGFDPNTK